MKEELAAIQSALKTVFTILTDLEKRIIELENIIKQASDDI